MFRGNIHASQSTWLQAWARPGPICACIRPPIAAARHSARSCLRATRVRSLHWCRLSSGRTSADLKRAGSGMTGVSGVRGPVAQRRLASRHLKCRAGAWIDIRYRKLTGVWHLMSKKTPSDWFPQARFGKPHSTPVQLSKMIASKPNFSRTLHEQLRNPHLIDSNSEPVRE